MREGRAAARKKVERSVMYRKGRVYRQTGFVRRLTRLCFLYIHILYVKDALVGASERELSEVSGARRSTM